MDLLNKKKKNFPGLPLSTSTLAIPFFPTKNVTGRTPEYFN